MTEPRPILLGVILAGLLAFAGCASVRLSDTGELAGMTFTGGDAPCVAGDRAVVIDNFSVDFLAWPVLSGSMEWLAPEQRLRGNPTFGDELTQAKFLAVLQKVADREHCTITHVEFDHTEDFPFGVTLSWYSCIKWLFPMENMSCSAILRVKEADE